MRSFPSHRTNSADRRPRRTDTIAKTVLSCLVVVAVLTTGLAAPSATGSSQSSARYVAMSGACIGLASGVDAARYNPANLGLSGYNRPGLELVGVGVAITNNSLSLNDYNSYTGAVLTESDKDEIMGKIPSEGLKLVADVEASALSLSLGSVVLSTRGVGVAEFNLNRDLLDLVLNGNTFGQEISITGSYSEAVAYVQTGLSYGQPIYSLGSRQLSVGATIKYLRGFGTESITELDGGVTTLETGFTGAGHMIARTATGGSGWGLDVGAALRLDDDYTVGLAVRNFLSSINWTQNPEEHSYQFSFDTMTVDNMGDDYIVSDDYTREIPAFSTNLPSVMTIGIANTSGSLLWAVDWEQGFRRAAGASSKPRLAAGLEWWPIKLTPVRAGFASGGSKGTGFSFGSGIYLSGFHLDFAAVTGSSLSPGSTRGVNFAVSTGLNF
ncbi:MAG: hypothetical protein KAW91_07075 [candidate division Zixibacteria bacterium]|nr:hypothetical protein [candidate division Zixibacteria bacterium]